MSELPKLSTIARASWKFSLDLNAYLKKWELLDQFTEAAGHDEIAEWRALHRDCYHLLAMAEFDKESPREAYAETLMLRLGELNARIGSRAFGAPMMKNFMPAAGRHPEAYRKMASPALAGIAGP